MNTRPVTRDQETPRFHHHVNGIEIPGLPAPLRCPFCGKIEFGGIVTYDVSEADRARGYVNTYAVQCDACGAEGPCGGSLAEAAQRWNGASLKPGSIAAGYTLAIEMLTALETGDGITVEECSFEAGQIDGGVESVYRTKPQRNIVLEYIDGIGGDRAKLEGFCAVMTDLVASVASGNCPEAELYEKITARTTHQSLKLVEVSNG